MKHLHRAMIANQGTRIDTATWQQKNGVWHCLSASFGLRWMKGMQNFQTVKDRLKSGGWEWHWLPGKYPVVQPPFMP